MRPSPTDRIPVLPVRNLVMYPGVVVPIRVGRAKSVAAVKKAAENGNWIVVLASKGLELDDEKEAGVLDVHQVGCLAHIERRRGNDSDGYQVVVRGDVRFRVTNLEESGGMLMATGEEWRDRLDVETEVAQALLESLKKLAKEILGLLNADTKQLSQLIEGLEDVVYLSYLAAANLEIPMEVRQELLEFDSVKARVLRLLDLMQKQKDSLEVQGEIRDKLSNRMGKMQREAILRQHLNAIREELGETNGESSGDEYKKKIEDAQMPEEVKKTALEELKRLESIGPSSPESHVIRNYLDLLCTMPWKKASEAPLDLDLARETLDKDHYGLEKIKKRIIQTLAVMKLKKDGKSPILLLVGPPGVGKTSLGQSVAKALGRKFVRASVGGVRDDAEIRGHRRTYIGAMPGRIIQGIKRAGVNNPVFMLDEIDKLGASFQGDPASALLEVLDPEQNSTFMDHYLDVPFDLSHVLFVGTANTLDTIPRPLLDRMEVIELSGYTTAEKLHIAKNHLVPKQKAEHGIEENKLKIGDETILRIIHHYTREAGVRELQRHLAAVCRGSTEKVLKATEHPVVVEASDLEELLGPERFTHEVAERVAAPGVATGLAWTPMGGEILFVEASLMPGSGKLMLTGQLGDVMKESAQIALSLVRSRLIPSTKWDPEKRDLHIHVPSGAIPKDGPSAGVTILTTIASLLTGRSVSPKLAMTGEITLRGAVMPVGGIKEKVIAAHRAGIDRVILSRKNERDLKEVPEEVRSALKFDFADTVSDVLGLALGLELHEPSLPLGPPPSEPPSVAA